MNPVLSTLHEAMQARALAATGMVPAALRWLRHIEVLDPANAEAGFATGMLHAHQKAWPEAEQASALLTDPHMARLGTTCVVQPLTPFCLPSSYTWNTEVFLVLGQMHSSTLKLAARMGCAE